MTNELNIVLSILTAVYLLVGLFLLESTLQNREHKGYNKALTSSGALLVFIILILIAPVVRVIEAITLCYKITKFN